MNKLEVGMYVRTTELYGGLISHITKICEETKTVMLYGSGPSSYPFKEIEKASYNIIDLIEVGDYVNGLIVNDIVTDIDGTKTFNLFKQLSYFGNEDIKSIVTKEQFKSMEYRLGE